MKHLLLFCLFAIAFTVSVQAQTCTPNIMYQDSLPGPFPKPYVEETMTGGIPDSACLGGFYEFNLTIVIPETFNFSGLDIAVDSFVISTVSNLPQGMSHACNPSNCVLIAGELGCVTIYGTPEELGTFDISIDGAVHSPVLANPIPIAFPDENLAPGNYYLTVLDPAQGECTPMPASTKNTIQNYVQIQNQPNPFSYETQIELQAKKASVMTFQVYDLLGAVIYEEQVQVVEGRNYIPFNGSDLSNGIYLYSFSNQDGTITDKMVVNK